jgi:hypothetical protein
MLFDDEYAEVIELTLFDEPELLFSLAICLRNTLLLSL